MDFKTVDTIEYLGKKFRLDYSEKTMTLYLIDEEKGESVRTYDFRLKIHSYLEREKLINIRYAAKPIITIFYTNDDDDPRFSVNRQYLVTSSAEPNKVFRLWNVPDDGNDISSLPFIESARFTNSVPYFGDICILEYSDSLYEDLRALEDIFELTNTRFSDIKDLNKKSALARRINDDMKNL